MKNCIDSKYFIVLDMTSEAHIKFSRITCSVNTAKINIKLESVFHSEKKCLVLCMNTYLLGDFLKAEKCKCIIGT